jgi:RNA methyltransferase, TrmH family
MKPLSNALAKTISSLHTQHMRDKSGLFLIEGKKCLQEAVKHKIEIQQIVCSNFFAENNLPENLPGEFFLAEEKTFEQLATTDSSCGILAIAKTPKNTMEALFKTSTPMLVVADAIQDPGNIGTIIRTASAASAAGVILSKGSANPYNPKVVRSAMGTLFALPVVYDVSNQEIINALQQHKVRIIVSDANAKTIYSKADYSGSIALVFGSEGHGISDIFLKEAHETINIPMNNRVESLNVSVSAGIILYAASQERGYN